MMNSRRRRRPPRGRGSSRSLVEKWYQTCGSCLYDWISRARNVIDSSCVHESTNGRPPLSFRWNRIGTSMRPVVSQSSAGVSVGARISWPPIAFDLLADDLLDPHVHAPAERQHRPQAGPDLADEAAAHEQLVRGRFRVGGGVAQGREEEL